MPIDTIADLHEHLRLAIRVEMTTIPPYLYAMYSVEDPATDAAKLVRSVATEEMLHAALVANLLIAVGGEPNFHDPAMVPAYPGLLPHHVPDLTVDLAPLSAEVIRDVFLVIEQPGEHEAPPEPDTFETLGQFYHALEEALVRLDADHDLFAMPATDRQLGPNAYAPVKFDAAESGGLLIVHSLATALEALEIVIHQGEGLSDDKWADPSHKELTHYAKFLAMADGEIPIGRVFDAPHSPKLVDLPSELQSVARLFNAVYTHLLAVMDAAYRSLDPDGRDALVGTMYGLMEALMRPLARYLFTEGDGRAGPTFEFHAFESDAPAELRALGDVVGTEHPSLRPVVEHLSRL